MTENAEVRPGGRAFDTSRRVFVTYAREDRELVQRLRSGFQRMSHDVWIDERLSVGQDWWNEILRQIRLADVMVVAISPALLESFASRTEREYARALGKAFLPVMVRPVPVELLPRDLAALHFVDYSDPGADAAFALADALVRTPASPPLPDPLPDPPDPPYSHLTDLAERVHRQTLGLDEQMVLVAKLRAALQRTDDRPAVLQLMRSLAAREDLFNGPAKQLEALMEGRAQYPPPSGDPVGPGAPPQGGDRPGGAAPPPSGGWPPPPVGQPSPGGWSTSSTPGASPGGWSASSAPGATPGGWSTSSTPGASPGGWSASSAPGAPTHGSPSPGAWSTPHGGGPYGALPATKNNLGTIALVLGIAGIVLALVPILGIGLGVAALVVGRNAKQAVQRGLASNRGMAAGAVVCGIIAIVLGVLVWIAETAMTTGSV